jgi:hypothetical protein
MLKFVFLLALLYSFVAGQACESSSTCQGCLNVSNCAWCVMLQSCSQTCTGYQKTLITSCPLVTCSTLSVSQCASVAGCATYGDVCFEAIPTACVNPINNNPFGYWKQHDFTVAWCERKRGYQQEPLNMASALFMTVTATFYLGISAYLDNGMIILVLYALIALNGLLSALGHLLAWIPFTSTDAQTMVIPIIIATAGTMDEVLEFVFGRLDSPRARFWRAAGIMITTLFTSMALPALQAGGYIIFVITFGLGVVFVVVFQLVYFSIIASKDYPAKRDEHLKLRNICIVAAVIMVLALICWILDHIDVVCQNTIPIFHFLWHILAAVALCNFIVLFSYQHANNCGHKTKIVCLAASVPFIKWEGKSAVV